MSEFQLIAALRERLGAIGRERIERGIGDDAAIWRPGAGQSVVTCCDTLIAGRHFPDDTDPADLGWKALAVNLSDLAAMGAAPVAALLALSLPAFPGSAWLDGFCDGWGELARRHDVALVGGDTTRGSELAMTVTCVGQLPHGTALCRDGARAGDGVYVSGTLGDAAQALACWQARDRSPRAQALFDRLCRPEPRLALGVALRGMATSAIDVSDGLAADLGHVLAASGVGATVELAKLPISDALRGIASPEEVQRRALNGGDDYELCFTVPAEREAALCAIAATCATRITRIGTITPDGGLRLIGPDGGIAAIPVSGWDHFDERA